MIGLKNNIVELSNYCPEWHEIYKKEEKKLINNMKNSIVKIQHIGSTAIPGMIAKPIIDILIGVDNSNCFNSALKPLIDLDYKFLGNGGKTGRLFFVKGDNEITKFHLHMVKIKSYYWSDYLFFRDYLKRNSKKAKEYKKIKLELMKKYRTNREKYRRFKSRFVKKILTKNEYRNCWFCDETQNIKNKSTMMAARNNLCSTVLNLDNIQEIITHIPET